MAPKPLYNWLDWWNTRRSSWGSIGEKARAQTSWGNARGGASAASNIAGANGTSDGTDALVVNASSSNDSPEQYISPQQYVVINDANPLLIAEAQSIWDYWWALTPARPRTSAAQTRPPSPSATPSPPATPIPMASASTPEA